jgi:hypothetical protein
MVTGCFKFAHCFFFKDSANTPQLFVAACQYEEELNTSMLFFDNCQFPIKITGGTTCNFALQGVTHATTSKRIGE